MREFGLLALAAVSAVVGVALNQSGGEWQAWWILAILVAALLFCAQVVLVSTRRGVLVTAVFAAGCNAYLLNQKFSPGDAICDVDQTISCSALNQSAASELFGIPVTLFGLAFYLGLALASLNDAKRAPRFDQVNGLFAIASLVFSAYLGWEAKKLGIFCPFCVAIYASNLLLMWAAVKGCRENDRTIFGGLDGIFASSSLWVVTATFAFVTLVGASTWRSHIADDPTRLAKQAAGQGGGGTLAVDTLARMYSSPRGNLRLRGDEPVLGNRDAPIKVVEFADYACPHCAHASPALKQLVQDHPEVQLVFKAFPLSGACNPVLQGTEGVERCKAALAAQCAGDQGRYFDLSAMLFKNIGYNSDEALAFMAEEIGLDMPRWGQCMGSSAALETVRSDAMAGAQAGVQGTPALFVSGLAGEGWIEIGNGGPEALRALVEARADGITLPAPVR